MKQPSDLLALLLMSLFFLQGCKYQKRELRPVKLQMSVMGTNDLIKVTAQSDSEETKQDLEGLLDIFFGTFVLPVNLTGESFDTRVDYEHLHDLRIKKDETFLRLVSKIENKFRNRDALKDRSDLYKKAFYINAYNYFSIRLINRYYMKDGKRINSILDLEEGPDKHKVFDTRFIRVHSEELISLNKLEQGLLSNLTRKKDGRTHFAVACAARDCSITLNKAYREDSLEEQLDEITKAALRLPRVFSNDNDVKKTYLSEIFSRHKEEFIADKGSVNAFIEYFGKEVLYVTEYQNYDWSLNSINSAVNSDIIQAELPKEEVVIESADNDEVISSEEERFCKKLILNEGEKLIASCDKLLSGKEHKLTKNTVTEANFCLIRNTVEDTYIIRGTMNSVDKNKVESLVGVDFGGKAKIDNDGVFTWRVKDLFRNEARFNPDEMILKFRQNTKKFRRSIRKIVVGCE